MLGTARPTSDSDIRFEVVIPAQWNGRYLQVGNGGFAGDIPERAMLAPLAQGYAVAGTDDGHEDTVNTDASWALNHPEKVIDFGYRALKETTDAAKAIVAANKGAAPRYSYFQGCSDGGREALMEAQRYPNDFNGIVAGDPANHWTHLLAGAAWSYQALTATPQSFLTLDKLNLVEAEAVKQCGDEDGVIEDPLACRFSPEKIRCTTGDAPNCLTDAQIAALRKIYDGPKNPRTGEKLMAGYSPGGEGEDNGWGRWITGRTPDGKDALIYRFASNFFGFIVKGDPSYDLKRLNFDSDVAAADAKQGPIFNSYEPRPVGLSRARRQADPVSRLGRPGDSGTGFRGLLPPGAEDDGQHGQFLPPLHGAGHAALWRRTRPQCSGRPACDHRLGANRTGRPMP